MISIRQVPPPINGRVRLQRAGPVVFSLMVIVGSSEFRAGEPERPAGVTPARATPRIVYHVETDVEAACVALGGRRGTGPVSGPRVRVTSGYDPARRHPISGSRVPHLGVDLTADLGSVVSPVLPGVVVASGPAGGFGTRVIVDHGRGFRSLYAHLLEARVRMRDSVSTSDTIGLVGMSGNATGAHLHLEFLRHGRPFNPCDLPIE